MDRSIILKYDFKLKTETFMTLDEMLIIDDCKYLILGNSVAGAIRSYLEDTEMEEEEILAFMGGEKDKKFEVSTAFISDANIDYKKKIEKEGTKINAEFGAAEEQNKYKFYHFPKGVNITFSIEAQTTTNNKCEVSKIIRTIIEGMDSGNLRFGGNKNNNFGKINVNEIKISEWVFKNIEDVNQYLESKGNAIVRNVKREEISTEFFRYIKANTIEIVLKGSFPYGVYQNFDITEENSKCLVTGIKGEIIPASSFKGLLRHEIEMILKTLNAKNCEKKLEEIFGGKNKKGNIKFFDIEAPKNEVKVNRFKKGNATLELMEENPVYLKIDRLTGGKINTALMNTKELYGGVEIKFQIESSENERFLFPILLTCIKIYRGEVPIGGKTSIGLGEFRGTSLSINGEIFEIEENLLNKLEPYYEVFKGWCSMCD